MVNSEKGSTRAQVLATLRNSDTPVSGEAIAGSIGVSRVAVWKAVKALNEAGYRISGGPAGYMLETDIPESIFPWEFGDEENRFRYLDETGSTMDLARDEALKGCADGLVVLADRQTGGRGTGSRKWESPAGGLFFTLVTRPGIPAAWSHRQVLRAQLAMLDAIRSVAGIEAFAGWPNDLLLPSGKTGGILCETLSSGNNVTFQNLGIGINTGRDVNRALPAGAPNALPPAFAAASFTAGRKPLLEAFLRSFARIPAESPGFSGDSLVRAWNARCPAAGKKVRYRRAGDNAIEEGLFTGIDAAGWAIIENKTHYGSAETIHFPPGSISLIDKGIRS